MAIVDLHDYNTDGVYPPNAIYPPNAWEHTNAQAAQEMQLAMQANQSPVNYPSLANVPYQGTRTSPTTDLTGRAREMFLKRVGGVRGELKLAPGDFLQCHIYGEVVHVFYCFSGKPGVAQEGIDLFPSDQLITQFRLILS